MVWKNNNDKMNFSEINVLKLIDTKKTHSYLKKKSSFFPKYLREY